MAHLDARNRVTLEEARNLQTSLETHDFEGFTQEFRAYLASIPYQWHTTGSLARYEAWYAGLLHMCFRAIGIDVRSEEASSHGRADMVVRTGGQVFVLEFKMAETEDDAAAKLEEAFAQMRERGYGDRYRGQPVHLVAVVCGREARNLLEIRVQPGG